ncbi:MAG TPA: hypothetical protein VGX26_08660 [Solirubrobacteraceae bacterium]|jgi:hypothetical protein|nr:hypothetical protein [Solirubrobacteraceae bacterium]
MGDQESIEAVRDALKRVVTGGLVPFNVGEEGGCLLELEVVRVRLEQLDGKADEAERYEADLKALRSVLEDAVEHKDIGGKSRRVLRAVLPLNPKYVGKPIKERRTLAGKEIRPDKKPISAGAIRNDHEPKALKKLAGVLWLMELEFRANATSSNGPAESDGSAS